MKFINPEIVPTADGSESLYLKELDEHYHSHHGALQESVHVYIKSGVEYVLANGFTELKIFELGLGTCLNAFLTLAYAEKYGIDTTYYSIEKYPVEPSALKQMNYKQKPELMPVAALCDAIIDAEWDKEVAISPNFSLFKNYGDFLTFHAPHEVFNVLYFDAFGFRAQSEMWSEEVFQKCYDLLMPGGVLVTYASKGSARRAMEAVGFKVERIKGAPGKREMMRAIKPIA